MHIKRIICEVKEGFEKEFSVAQEQWVEIRGIDGFIGQIGGWDLNRSRTAYIIGFWKAEYYLKQFMKNIHDKIFFKNSQSEFYDSIRVNHFDSLSVMDDSYNSLLEALNYAKVLQVTEYIVRSEKVEFFETFQKDIRIAERKRIQGVLGVDVAKATDNKPEYLVSTLWDTVQNFNKYTMQKMPEYANINLENDIKTIITGNILLSDAWRII